MQNLLNRFVTNEWVSKLNSRLDLIKAVKSVFKFLFAVLAYCCLNTVVALLFNTYKPVSPEALRFLHTTIYDTLSQNIVMFYSLYSEYRYFAVSIMTVVYMLSMAIGIVVLTYFVFVCVKQSNVNTAFIQKTVQRANVFSYKHHIAFLA